MVVGMLSAFDPKVFLYSVLFLASNSSSISRRLWICPCTKKRYHVKRLFKQYRAVGEEPLVDDFVEISNPIPILEIKDIGDGRAKAVYDFSKIYEVRYRDYFPKNAAFDLREGDRVEIDLSIYRMRKYSRCAMIFDSDVVRRASKLLKPVLKLERNGWDINKLSREEQKRIKILVSMIRRNAQIAVLLIHTIKMIRGWRRIKKLFQEKVLAEFYGIGISRFYDKSWNARYTPELAHWGPMYYLHLRKPIAYQLPQLIVESIRNSKASEHFTKDPSEFLYFEHTAIPLTIRHFMSRRRLFREILREHMRKTGSDSRQYRKRGYLWMLARILKGLWIRSGSRIADLFNELESRWIESTIEPETKRYYSDIHTEIVSMMDTPIEIKGTKKTRFLGYENKIVLSISRYDLREAGRHLFKTKDQGIIYKLDHVKQQLSIHIPEILRRLEIIK
jgi:hypothetical protein